MIVRRVAIGRVNYKTAYCQEVIVVFMASALLRPVVLRSLPSAQPARAVLDDRRTTGGGRSSKARKPIPRPLRGFLDGVLGGRRRSGVETGGCWLEIHPELAVSRGIGEQIGGDATEADRSADTQRQRWTARSRRNGAGRPCQTRSRPTRNCGSQAARAGTAGFDPKRPLGAS